MALPGELPIKLADHSEAATSARNRGFPCA
jgi:hypothetical protein